MCGTFPIGAGRKRTRTAFRTPPDLAVEYPPTCQRTIVPGEVERSPGQNGDLSPHRSPDHRVADVVEGGAIRIEAAVQEDRGGGLDDLGPAAARVREVPPDGGKLRLARLND